jgi:hypothetical protein
MLAFFILEVLSWGAMPLVCEIPSQGSDQPCAGRIVEKGAQKSRIRAPSGIEKFPRGLILPHPAARARRGDTHAPIG